MQRLFLFEDSLLKCVTLNWKENSVKVQLVVYEREKRKAKEVAAFFFCSRRISDRKGGKRIFLYLISSPFHKDAQLVLRAVSRPKISCFEGRDGRVRVREENT